MTNTTTKVLIEIEVGATPFYANMLIKSIICDPLILAFQSVTLKEMESSYEPASSEDENFKILNERLPKVLK